MSSDDFEHLRYERSLLQAELDYRRRRRWEIFRWVNTVLLGVVGGVIFFQPQTLTVSQKLIGSLAILVIGLYSAAWWERQRRIGRQLHAAINDVDQGLGRPQPPYKSTLLDPVGGLFMILLLAMTAIAAIWVSPV